MTAYAHVRTHSRTHTRQASQSYPQIEGVPVVELTPHGLQHLLGDLAALRLRSFKEDIVPYLQASRWVQVGATLVLECSSGKCYQPPLSLQKERTRISFYVAVPDGSAAGSE